jgi:protein phosphatase
MSTMSTTCVVEDDNAISSGYATAIGGRAVNQDRGFAAGGLAVVADGVGGGPAGEVAAAIAVEVAADGLRQPATCATIVEVFRAADEAVRKNAAENWDRTGMATTLTVAAVSHDGHALVAHVGDSPALLVGADGVVLLTEPHTLTAGLLAQGLITADEAATHPRRNMLVRAVGDGQSQPPDLHELDLASGDAILVASDGLLDALGTDLVHAIVGNGGDAAVAARALVDAAVLAGARDNVTAAVVRVDATSRSRSWS